ncbi:tetratricopeptide repeat protein [Psychrobacter sp. I-STPA10]|uniref:tetratricopeptide repeat protein n=1 Tax=Psychrobacter sp. I-STPA10 TaxID=2585769 RepID=UPI001E37F61C|nr:hypothetical protein [Psychrobacter sp. I-STPA10]
MLLSNWSAYRIFSNKPLLRIQKNHCQYTKANKRLLRPLLLGICLAVSGSLYSPNAQANIFDSLLRILLPSYSKEDTKEDTQNESSSTMPDPNAPIDNTTNIQDPLADDSVLLQQPDNELLTSTDDHSLHHQPSLYALLMAEFDVDRGNIKQALNIYKQQSFNDEATAVFERALKLSLKYESTEDSLAFAQAWQKQNPDHIPAQFFVAHLALKAHKYEVAGEALSQILSYDPQADLSEILIGIYPNKPSDQQQLLAILQALPNHENPSILVMKAGLQLQFNQPEVALVNINNALKILPDSVPFITLKADILQRLKSPTDVIKYISDQRKRLPDRKGLYLYEIRYRLAQGQTTQGWELLQEAHTHFSNDEEITLLAALVGIDVGAYAKADTLLLSLAASPYYLDQAYYYLGISAERQHNYAAAERYLSKVMQENLVLAARRKVVAIQLLNNDPEAAIATLDKLSAQFDVFAPESAVLKAEILRQLDKLDEAQQVLATASANHPDNSDILFAQVQLLDNKKDYEKKHALLTQLMLLDPENTEYQLSYATLLFKSQHHVDESLNIARQLINIAYDDPRYRSDIYLQALNLLAANALAEAHYQEVIDYLSTPYEVLPTLETGVLLLRAYQGLGNDAQVKTLLQDLQSRFAFGQKNISDQVQSY